MSYDGKVTIDTGMNNDGIKRGLDDAKKEVEAFSAKLNQLAMSDKPPRGIIGMQKAASNASVELSKLEETYEKLQLFSQMDISAHGMVSPQKQSCAGARTSGQERLWKN